MIWDGKRFEGREDAGAGAARWEDMAGGTSYNKNLFGFKHRLISTLFKALAVLFLLIIIWRSVLGPFMYQFYLKQVTPQQGEAGTPAGEDVPAAESLEQMKEYGKFTLLVDADGMKYDDVRIGEDTYYCITLPSGETVMAKVFCPSVQKTEEAGISRMPVGTLQEWDYEARGEWFEEFLTTMDYYVDMSGDNAVILSQTDYTNNLRIRKEGLVFLILVFLLRFIGVRRGKFAPAIFIWRDPLLPRNRLEYWCASTYAIWSCSFRVLEGWPLVTGGHRHLRAVISMKTSLSNQWDINGKEEGIETVLDLTERYETSVADPEAGWDLCRATQLLGMMYHIRMLNRRELDMELERVARVIRQQFHSWEELCESYLWGYETWVAGQPGAEENIAKRRMIYEKLKNKAHGPYTIPWQLEFSEVNGQADREERKLVKELLNGYLRN